MIGFIKLSDKSKKLMFYVLWGKKGNLIDVYTLLIIITNYRISKLRTFCLKLLTDC